MGVGNVSIHAFNRGLLGKNALARTDLERTGLSAEIQDNFMPRTLGSMLLRPGFKHIGESGTSKAYLVPFIFATDDTALIEMSAMQMRISVDGSFITRAANSTNVVNGTFDADITSWTDDDDANCVSQWVTGGYLGLTGTMFNSARMYQELTVLAGDTGVLHAARIVVERGSCKFRVGTSANDDDVLEDVTLTKGEHSITFTPGATSIFIQVESATLYETLIDFVVIDTAGTLEIPTMYPLDALPLLRWDQSGDVVYLSSHNYPQQKIERRPNDSWSIVDYDANDGPFLLPDTTGTTITPDAINGGVTLTASAGVFKSTMVDGLIQLTSAGQTVSATVGGPDEFTTEILLTGTSAGRDFLVNISGTWTGTITVQQSVGIPDIWTDFNEYTGNTVDDLLNDGFDEAVVYYRIGFKSGDWSTGSAVVTLSTSAGFVDGVVRITGYTSETVVTGIVTVPLGGTDATSIWREGSWSTKNGYPGALAIYEGRLWFAGQNGIWGSISDAYLSFDPTITGDSGTISRNIGFGPVDKISWILRLSRLVAGTQGSEIVIRSSTFDEPLTPSNFNLKDPSNQGSAEVAAVKVDSGGFYVQRSGVRLFQLEYDAVDTFDYNTRDVSVHAPEVGRPEILRIASQRQPDTRIHCIRSDGTAAVLVFDKAEDVLAWVTVQTDGNIEDVAVLPGVREDEVYYVVSRKVDGVDTRFIERWAIEDDLEVFTTYYVGVATQIIETEHENGTLLTARNPDGTKLQNVTVVDGQVTLNSQVTEIYLTTTICPLADNYREFDNTGTATATLTGLGDFQGKEVVVWADGKDQGSFSVPASGSITLNESVEYAIVGLGYKGRYRSTKLTYAAEAGAALNQVKKVERLGLILRHAHHMGLTYGPRFTQLNDLPGYEHEFGEVFEGFCFDQYDTEMHGFEGDWNTDSRVCIESNAPRPCTVLGLVVGMETIDDV